MSGYPEIPDEIAEKLARARRLEWWTIFFLATIVAVMYFALGSSQAMRTAWIEDILSLVPPILFLAATHFERKEPTWRYPYGFHRAGSLAFFVAACALCAMGGILLYEAAMTLVTAEHPTVGSVRLWGHEVWLGWPMIAALAYSAVPPVILGRMKKELGKELHDKVLHTDAQMNAADWKTAVAGIAGLLGLYLGFWWTDAAAAGLISFSILKDGVTSGRIALAELIDGAPRSLDSRELEPVAERIREGLEQRYPDADIRVRQSGRFIRAVVGSNDTHPTRALARDLAGADEGWRLIEISVEQDQAAPDRAQVPR